MSAEWNRRPIAENDRHGGPSEFADPLAQSDQREPPVGPRPVRRTRRWQWVTGIVVEVVIYVVMLAVYAFGGGNAVPEPTFAFPPGGAAVFLAVRSVTAAVPSMDVDVLLLPDPDLLDDQGAPKQPITLLLGPTRDGTDISGRPVGASTPGTPRWN